MINCMLTNPARQWQLPRLEEPVQLALGSWPVLEGHPRRRPQAV